MLYCAPKLPELLVLVCSYTVALCCIDAADAVIRSPGLRAQVMLQISIFVLLAPLLALHPQSSLDWLACLKKVRMKRMLVLHFCTVLTMPTVLFIGSKCECCAQGLMTLACCACNISTFSCLQCCCVVTSSEKHCHASAARSNMDVSHSV